LIQESFDAAPYVLARLRGVKAPPPVYARDLEQRPGEPAQSCNMVHDVPTPARELLMNNPPSRTPDGVRLLGVEFTLKGVLELDDGKRDLFIARSAIDRCTIRSGFVAERVVLGVIAGLCMLIFGAGVGAIIVKNSLRRGFYLELATPIEVRKLTIGTMITQAALSAFILRARDELGYVIEVDDRVKSAAP
jgi:hypothetical protein